MSIALRGAFGAGTGAVAGGGWLATAGRADGLDALVDAVAFGLTADDRAVASSFNFLLSRWEIRGDQINMAQEVAYDHRGQNS